MYVLHLQDISRAHHPVPPCPTMLSRDTTNVFRCLFYSERVAFKAYLLPNSPIRRLYSCLLNILRATHNNVPHPWSRRQDPNEGSAASIAKVDGKQVSFSDSSLVSCRRVCTVLILDFHMLIRQRSNRKVKSKANPMIEKLKQQAAASRGMPMNPATLSNTLLLKSQILMYNFVNHIDWLGSRPVVAPAGEIQFVDALVAKYGNDYVAMARDHKLNIYQHTPSQIKKKILKVKATLDLAETQGVSVPPADGWASDEDSWSEMFVALTWK